MLAFASSQRQFEAKADKNDIPQQKANSMTFHIGAKAGEIAETVLLPGDPYRARWAAQTFLENPVLVNEVRGMLGYTGTWHGHRVTIHGSGMGMPSMSIYATELMKDYGAQTLIRIGSAGALQHHVKIRDVVLAQTTSTNGSPSRSIFREMNFAPCADFALLQAAHQAAQRRACRPMSAASTRPTAFMMNGRIYPNSCNATAPSASRWKPPSFTPSPRDMAVAPLLC